MLPGMPHPATNGPFPSGEAKAGRQSGCAPPGRRAAAVPPTYSEGEVNMSISLPCEVPRVQKRLAGQGVDLRKAPGVRAIMLWRGFPYVLQAAMLAVFVGLIWLGWGSRPPTGSNAKLFAKSHLVTLLIWGLWWPAMVWIAVLLGRAWCMACPLELVSNGCERIGRRIGLPQQHVRKWLASGIVILALYAAIQLLVAGAQLHRTPHYTAIFLLTLLIGAAIAGLLLKDRAFCRAFCPVGLLLGTYGRGGMLAVRSRSAATCAGCTGRDCLLACNRGKLDGRSCPSLLSPPKLDTNRDCLVCGQCIKACRPDNMTLLLRRPFSVADAREPLASWPVTLFVMLVSGFVTSELCAEWPSAQHAFHAVPAWLNSLHNAPTLKGYVSGLWALALFPTILWSVLVLGVRLIGRSDPVGEILRRLALPMAVILSAGHMAKGLAKFTSWAGFVPLAMRDPSGSSTLTALGTKTIASPASLLPVTAVSAIGALLVLVGLVFALRELTLRTGSQRADRFALATVAALFLPIILGWSTVGR